MASQKQTSAPAAPKVASRPRAKSDGKKPAGKQKQPQSMSAATAERKARLARAKKQKQSYTDAELGLPQLNKITPLGVQKPKGKKKGKVFVDDPESIMTIFAMVNAEKEGQTESKMVKARHMEELREARRVEAERKKERKQTELEDVKGALRQRRRDRRKRHEPVLESPSGITGNAERRSNVKRKRVSFKG